MALRHALHEEQAQADAARFLHGHALVAAAELRHLLRAQAGAAVLHPHAQGALGHLGLQLHAGAAGAVLERVGHQVGHGARHQRTVQCHGRCVFAYIHQQRHVSRHRLGAQVGQRIAQQGRRRHRGLVQRTGLDLRRAHEVFRHLQRARGQPAHLLQQLGRRRVQAAGQLQVGQQHDAAGGRAQVVRDEGQHLFAFALGLLDGLDTGHRHDQPAQPLRADRRDMHDELASRRQPSLDGDAAALLRQGGEGGRPVEGRGGVDLAEQAHEVQALHVFSGVDLEHGRRFRVGQLDPAQLVGHQHGRGHGRQGVGQEAPRLAHRSAGVLQCLQAGVDGVAAVVGRGA